MNAIEFKKIKQNDPYYMEILALRYKVYCMERGFEPPDDHSDGFETDQYDAHSIHFAAIVKQTQQVVGTVRLILYSGEDFPVESFFELTRNPATLDRHHIGEISRLALSRGYRYPFQGRSTLRCDFNRERVIKGLFRCVAKECEEQDISHLYAVMSKGLPVLLAREKITFLQIGLEKEYHGLRAPYLGTVKDIMSQNSTLFMGCDGHASIYDIA